MSTNDNGRTEARSRANRRLRRMTVGTTMLGVAAASAFGLLAAATEDGTTSTGGETAIVAASPATIGTPTTSTTSTTTAGTTSTATAAPTVTGISGSGHASTGGS